MAPHAAVVIDLTEYDDDHIVAQRAQQHLPPCPVAPPYSTSSFRSHDGLPVAFQFNAGNNQAYSNNCPGSAPLKAPHNTGARYSTDLILPPPRHNAHQPPAYQEYPTNPPKKRKTDNSPASHVPHSLYDRYALQNNGAPHISANGPSRNQTSMNMPPQYSHSLHRPAILSPQRIASPTIRSTHKDFGPSKPAILPPQRTASPATKLAQHEGAPNSIGAPRHTASQVTMTSQRSSEPVVVPYSRSAASPTVHTAQSHSVSPQHFNWQCLAAPGNNPPQHSDRLYKPILPPSRASPVVQSGNSSKLVKVLTPVTSPAPENLHRASSVKASPVPKDLSENSLATTGSIKSQLYTDDPRMKSTVQLQVLKHVKDAVAKYESTLEPTDRTRIGIQAAETLLSDPAFVKDFEANSFRLSNRYESSIVAKAKSLVDNLAAGILIIGPSSGSAEQPSLTTEKGTHTQVEVAAPRTVIRLAPSSRSSSEENLDPQRGNYSSSPTTSYSNDIDEDDLASNTSNGKETITADTSTRPTRSSSPNVQIFLKPETYARPNPESKSKLSNINPMKETSNVCNRSGHSIPSKPKTDPWQRAQSLGITGLDTAVRRPYLSFTEREELRSGLVAINNGEWISPHDRQALSKAGDIFHVDLCKEELDAVLYPVLSIFRVQTPLHGDSRSRLTALMRGNHAYIDKICETIRSSAIENIGTTLLRRRGQGAVSAFLHDAAEGKIDANPQIHRLQVNAKHPRRHQTTGAPSVSALLRQREMDGLEPSRIRQGNQQFSFVVSSVLEDTITRQSEWTDCCGDISALNWTSDSAFVCGATAHSDHHNQQYNKPGNLCLGSFTLDTLRAVPDHRIPRPLIDKADNAENALDSMRQTQDPWLYTSVVSTAWGEKSGLTFTASFDATVKIWKVIDDGSSMSLQGSWQHDRKVNFVVTSANHEKVATAADISNDAIRVYHLNDDDISMSTYDTYSGDRAQEQARELEQEAKWAYFPATIAWGKSTSVVDLLLVGYSPRSITGHELDIPEEKRNMGELSMWSTLTRERVLITSSHTQNVFEVVWHPTQPIFLAATSPCGPHDAVTKTQIRLFAQSEHGTFCAMKSLDCRASDINELTIMANSRVDCYVTASCTDGNTYVWDTAQGDDPVHVLGHGESLDNPVNDIPREEADTGVKFVSWGQTSDRLYTGSSDGKVKAWDVRAPKGQAFVRTVITLSGGISSGCFSRDFSKLIIGDATGKVHLLGIENTDIEDVVPAALPGNASSLPNRPYIPMLGRRAPKVIIPHKEPATSSGDEPEEEQTAQALARIYLEEGQLQLHPDRMIGVVQGPNYAETMLYRFEAHENADATMPLISDYNAKQQYRIYEPQERLRVVRLSTITSSDPVTHAKNKSSDFDVSQLTPLAREMFEQDDLDIGFEHDDVFDFEMEPSIKIFKRFR